MPNPQQPWGTTWCGQCLSPATWSILSGIASRLRRCIGRCCCRQNERTDKSARQKNRVESSKHPNLVSYWLGVARKERQLEIGDPRDDRFAEEAQSHCTAVAKLLFRLQILLFFSVRLVDGFDSCSRCNKAPAPTERTSDCFVHSERRGVAYLPMKGPRVCVGVPRARAVVDRWRIQPNSQHRSSTIEKLMGRGSFFSTSYSRRFFESRDRDRIHAIRPPPR